MKKPRSDSKLKNLPREQQEQIADWCQQDGYAAARARCKAELQIETSEAALSGFWQWFSLRSQFEAAAGQAAAAEELMREFDPQDAAKAEAFGQFVFTQSAVAAQDTETFVKLESLRLAKETARTKASHEARKIALAERRVKLLEDNAARAKAQLESLVSKGGLTPETLAQIEEAARLL